TDEIAEVAADQFICLRHGLFGDALDAGEAIDLVRALEHVEGAGGVGMNVFDGLGKEDEAWRAEGDEAILVKGKAVWLGVELLEPGAHPVREVLVEALDGFADLAAAWSGAAGAGLQ